MGTSPFVFTGPAPPDDVVGRDEVLEAITDRAAVGRFMRLAAPRRYGKTSLVGRLARDASAGSDLVVVRVDLLGVNALDDIEARMRSAWGELPEQRWAKAARAALRHLNLHVTAGGIGVEVRGQETLSSPDRRLETVLRVPVEVAQRLERRVLVVLDEFQAIAQVRNAAEVIRSVIQHHADRVSYLFAGSEQATLDLLFSQRSAPLYGQAEPIHLGPLPPGPAAELIAARFADTGLSVDDEALDAVLALCGGHPQRTMLIAHHLWTVAAGTDDGHAGLDCFDAAMRAALGWVRPEAEAVMTSLSGPESKLLRLSAWGEPPFGAAAGRLGLGQSSAQRAAESLERASHIRGRAVVDPLLALWLRSSNPHP